MGLFKRRPTGDPAPPTESGQTHDPWSRVAELQLRPWESLTEPERQLVAIGELRTEVNNGGFHQYFFNSAGDAAPDAIAAATSLELTPLVDLVERAMALFDGRYTADRSARQDLLEELDITGSFEALDTEFYRLEAALDLDTSMLVLAKRP